MTAEMAYMWLYFLTSIAVPLCVLAFCNIYLIRALRVTSELRKQYSGNTEDVNSTTNIVTLTLSVIVIFYVLLVGPAELLNFGRYFIVKSKPPILFHIKYSLAVAIGNTLEAVNFAFNFILYCIVNVRFRQVMCQMFCLLSRHKHKWSVPAKRQCGTHSRDHHDNRYNLMPLKM